MLHRLSVLACVAALALGSLPAAAETVRIGGTGGAMGMLKRLAKPLAEHANVELDVVPSLGSAGGLKAVADGVIDLSITGRTLTDTDRARGLTQAAMLRTPYIFATSRSGPVTMAGRDIVGVYANIAPTWRDGRRIKLILRPQSEDDNAVIGGLFPGMASAMAIARVRTELPIATTDQDNADLGEALTGSFAGMTYTQLVSEQRDLRAIAIDGVAPNIETFESGRYAHGKVFRIISRQSPGAAAERFLNFITTSDGIRAMREAGCLSVSD